MLNLVKSFTMQVNFQLTMVSIQHLNLVSIFNVEKWHPPPPNFQSVKYLCLTGATAAANSLTTWLLKNCKTELIRSCLPISFAFLMPSLEQHVYKERKILPLVTINNHRHPNIAPVVSNLNGVFTTDADAADMDRFLSTCILKFINSKRQPRT